MTWKHRLTEVDATKRTALCAECGEVTIQIGRRTPSGQIVWRCGQAERIRRMVRKHAYYAYKHDKCDRCGFDPVDSCQLDVHHRDHDHTNNDPDNLETLCANCHRLEHRGARKTS